MWWQPSLSFASLVLVVITLQKKFGELVVVLSLFQAFLSSLWSASVRVLKWMISATISGRIVHIKFQSVYVIIYGVFKDKNFFLNKKKEKENGSKPTHLHTSMQSTLCSADGNTLFIIDILSIIDHSGDWQRDRLTSAPKNNFISILMKLLIFSIYYFLLGCGKSYSSNISVAYK